MMRRKLLFLPLMLCLHLYTVAQQAYIHSDRHVMLQSTLNGKSLAWQSESFEIILNKWTGDLVMNIPVDHLYVKALNPDFLPTGESKGRTFSISAVVPIGEVLEQGAEFMDVFVEGEIYFNEKVYDTGFNFTVLKMFPNGFSIQGDGRFSHSYFGIESLEDAEDEMVIVFKFSGE